MKPKKFQRVVEWKEKPDWDGIWFGIVMILVSTIFFCGSYLFPDPTVSIRAYMSAIVVVSLIHFIGWMILIHSTGIGKQIYWEEVE